MMGLDRPFTYVLYLGHMLANGFFLGQEHSCLNTGTRWGKVYTY